MCSGVAKNLCAIMLLAVVDADGLFTFVDAGCAGSMGDAFTFNHSSLKEKIDAGEWLEGQAQEVQGRLVRPYLVADSAFALTQSLIKGYDYPPAPGHQKSFNAAVVEAGRVVEIAFGQTKGRFRILTSNFINDPSFTADVALACCVLNNICERAKCPFSDTWLAEESPVIHANHGVHG